MCGLGEKLIVELYGSLGNCGYFGLAMSCVSVRLIFGTDAVYGVRCVTMKMQLSSGDTCVGLSGSHSVRFANMGVVFYCYDPDGCESWCCVGVILVQMIGSVWNVSFWFVWWLSSLIWMMANCSLADGSFTTVI